MSVSFKEIASIERIKKCEYSKCTAMHSRRNEYEWWL